MLREWTRAITSQGAYSSKVDRPVPVMDIHQEEHNP